MGKPEVSAVEAALVEQQGASFTLHGAGVSGGIAIGYAHLISTARLEVAHYEIPREEIEAETERLDAAIEQVRGELVGLHAAVPADAPAEMGAFLDLHLMILNDALLSAAPRELIRTRRWNAEWALVHQMEILVHRFEEIEDAYLRERKIDVQQVVERVLKAMLGTGHQPAPPEHEEDIIVVAHDLSPADMILFKQHEFAAFVTDLGGVTSHTAIVARSLNLPAIVGLHHARHMIREGELLIVDGTVGVLIVNPDRQVLAEYQLRRSQFDLERQKLKRLKTMPAATVEGITIALQANIELPEDVGAALEAGATGVGLFRSEFLFLNRDDLPDEDEQFEAYRQVVLAMNGHPVTIRTLDLGADKTLNGEHFAGPNPAPGLRARGGDLHEEARLPVDRHQRPDPIHARDRSHRRQRRAPVRSSPSRGAAARRAHDPHRDQGRRPGRGVRRGRGRRRADPAAARARPEAVLDASGAAARGQAAGAPLLDPGGRASRAADPALRGPRADARASR